MSNQSSNSNAFSIVYFHTPTCSACSPLYDKLEQLISSKFPKCSLEKIDLATSPELRAMHKVFSAPTMLLLIEGKETLRLGATVSLIEIEQKLKRLYDLYY